MSIATDEAEKKYPRDVALTAAFENNICRRTGYIAGRNAEVTDAEIKAAAKRIFIFLNGPWQGKHYELSYVDGLAIADAAWETDDKQWYRACAEFALNDARKAVTE